MYPKRQQARARSPMHQPPMTIPTLETPRLVLRPFVLEDAPVVQRLAGAYEVASTTLNMPYRYEDGMAEAWIGSHEASWNAREGLVLAMTSADEGLVGAIGVDLSPDHERGELGYWVGLPYWNRGYATEACAALLDWCFDTLGLNRIQAQHFTRNPASGRVLQKIGMSPEGIRRQHFLRMGQFQDVAWYGILRSDRPESPT